MRGTLLVSAWVVAGLVAACGNSGSSSSGGSDASLDTSSGGVSGTGAYGSGGTGGPASGGSGAVAASGGRAGGSGAGGASGAAGSGGDACAGTSCDDGVPCTRDGCIGGACTHAIDPNACPAGSYCDMVQGCVGAPACATTQQCVDKWQGDACKTQITCDPATATCHFQTLDKDHDGHPPVVCGGDDCNDANPSAFAGHPEVCDGVDNDCNGLVDDGNLCGGFGACTNGVCACPTGKTYCGTACVDTSTDNGNCGFCGHQCTAGSSCVAGMCCNPLDVCGTKCVDKSVDNQNCGTCGHVCGAGYSCVNGTCQAGSGTCQDAFCPSNGVGTPCCMTSNGPCGIDTGMGCTNAPTGDY